MERRTDKKPENEFCFRHLLLTTRYLLLRERSAFTLIELLVTIALTAVVITGGLLVLGGYSAGRNLRSEGEQLVAALQNARQSSMAQQNGSRWGVHFSNTTSTQSYMLFSGLSYASGTIANTYALRGSTQFGNPFASSSIDVIFNAITGYLSSPQVISLHDGKSDGLVFDVAVNAIGKITTKSDTGLVGYWHFDEGTSTLAYDASGRGKNGTLTNGPTWQSGSNCKAGNCLNFDGTNDYIQLPTVSSYANAVTVTAWAYHNASSDWDDIVEGACGDLLFAFSNNYLTFGGQCANPFGMTTYVSNINSAWHHVAGVYTGSAVKLYVDGNEVASSTKSGSFTLFTPKIGGGNASENFNGRIDEVRIYNRALSAQEIKDQYNALQ